MKKIIILTALILMQFLGRAQSSEEVVSFAKDLFPEGFEYIEGKISEADEKLRQEAMNMFNSLDKSSNNRTISLSGIADAECEKVNGKAFLNKTPNVIGFNKRKAEGKKAGSIFIKQLNQSAFTTSDTLDIVCHSMGFAYALGMLEAIKGENIHLGGFYIIAPENGCSGSVDISDWQEIWQYGSNEENHDDIYKQDGVAPQCRVGGLDDVQGKSGRAYIPDDVVQGFISSHSIENYIWIFNKTKNENGYVTPKK